MCELQICCWLDRFPLNRTNVIELYVVSHILLEHSTELLIDCLKKLTDCARTRSAFRCTVAMQKRDNTYDYVLC